MDEERGAEQRALFRRWPAGVSVVVAEADGRRAGLTVSTLLSLSLEPRLIGISIALEASLHEVLRGADEWAVSILGGDQEHLAQHFARSVPPIAMWAGIGVRPGEGPPLLEGAIGWLTCRRVQELPAGDHTLFVGEVLAMAPPPGASSPLSYERGRLGRVVPHEDDCAGGLDPWGGPRFVAWG